MRDFEYDPKAASAEREERGKIELQLKKQFVCSTLCGCLYLKSVGNQVLYQEGAS